MSEHVRAYSVHIWKNSLLIGKYKEQTRFVRGDRKGLERFLRRIRKDGYHAKVNRRDFYPSHYITDNMMEE